MNTEAKEGEEVIAAALEIEGPPLATTTSSHISCTVYQPARMKALLLLSGQGELHTMEEPEEASEAADRQPPTPAEALGQDIMHEHSKG